LSSMHAWRFCRKKGEKDGRRRSLSQESSSVVRPPRRPTPEGTLLVRDSEISSIRELLAQATKRLRCIEEHALTCTCCREALKTKDG
jgi:hypothetical protein